MKTYIQDLKDITDSREMLESKPHFFLAWFAYILIGILVAALIWAYFGQIEDYVKAAGTVRPGEKISTIRNMVTGRVDEVYFEQGMKVKEGDVLYRIEIDGLISEKEQLERKVNRLETENNNLIKLKNSILENNNLFDNENIDEIDFYNRYRKYETDRLVSIEQYENQRVDMTQFKNESNVNLKFSQRRLEQEKERLEKYKRLEKSIEENKNLFDQNDIEFYNQYAEYEINIRQLEILKDQKSDNYERLEKLYEAGGISQIDLEDAKNQMELAAVDLNRYKSEYILNIKSTLRQTNQNIEEITATIEKSSSVTQMYDGKLMDKDLMLEKMKIDMLVQIEDELSLNKSNLDNANLSLRNVEINIDDSSVKAPISGVVNVYSEISRGDFLQGGVEIATIVPDVSTEYRVQLMVPNENIAEVELGQKIKYHFHALPFREYGEAEGTVQRISNDSRVDSETGISYYVVEATLEETKMESYKGDIREVKVGMACEAQVVTKSRSILRWLLEKINLRD
ncbi:HlyD family efflux transporter periplasmic adaptor subunit [Herbivorax sp. ANBcel31]|uniref:HlyD family efflux transporter periplasmic adaptor subunit n=1 Tax=Herbivorax sp. ANBcel31 TaxID=3069754 RepID=UPI0027B219D6|nr:HlyD family efflux transporter periplasmic adaptor subunit [Herbivorax sp. ANBcel31]MDQ2085157.1 HlyD family efflux transporter periplasmic adaptor subunit [Herbivorax sp. ANBcel31]